MGSVTGVGESDLWTPGEYASAMEEISRGGSGNKDVSLTKSAVVKQEAHAGKEPPILHSFSDSLPPQPVRDTTIRCRRAKTNQMAFPCSYTVRPPRAVRPRGQRPRGFRPALTVVAAGTRASGAEARASLVLALASQALASSQRRAADLVTEATKYAFPSSRFEPRTLEEALMSVPDLETVPFRLLKREVEYEIREVEVIDFVIQRISLFYYLYRTMLPRRRCLEELDLISAGRLSHSTCWPLTYLNTRSEQMEMTTPVFTRKGETGGEKMDMTTPVITTKSADEDKWKMSFVMPAKYGPDLPQAKDPSVTIKEVPSKIIAVVAFPGLVTDDDISQRESRLREVLQKDTQYRVKENSVVEVAQYNPPFTLPFTRRNEVALEVEWLGGIS
ncbi:hypothetical protein ACQ4PT_033117 [Festuca glaucescens]